MNSKFTHIFKGIGWYLKNGKFIKDLNDKILFVGLPSFEERQSIFSIYLSGMPFGYSKDLNAWGYGYGFGVSWQNYR
jgi:hypothetical protein